VERGVLVVLGSLGLAYGLGATAIAHASASATTYAGHSTALAWSSALAGLALFAAGVATVRTRRLVGALAIVAASLWFAPVWEGWSSGPASVRSVGMLAASFTFPVLVHVVLAASERPMSPIAVALVSSTYVLVGGCAVIVVLVRDPYLDPYCWANCTTNVFEVSSQPELARRLVWLQSWVTTIAAAALAALCLVNLWRAVRRGARRHWEVLPGGVGLGAVTVAYTVLLRRQPMEDPAATGFGTVFLLRCLAVALIAAGIGAAPLQVRWQRRSVSRIVGTLGEAPPAGALETALAAAVGDPTLRVAYWLPDLQRYADASGHGVPDPSVTRAAGATPLVRHGETVAIVSHRTDPAELERQLGSAVRLALDNERLQAEVRARVNDLIASRSRIVEAADARRRDLERDLHDGAQQSLLGLSYDLQVARSAAAADGESDLVAVLDAAIVDVRAAFAELRDLAHGIFPAVLTAAGLGPAVKSLAESYRERGDLWVDVECAIDERCPAATETAAYVVVVSGLDASADCGAHHADVLVCREDGTVRIEIAHDGTRGFPVMVDVADRVGACGGRLAVDRTRVSAEIPCES
jgi:signal transduction histidine kinase